MPIQPARNPLGRRRGLKASGEFTRDEAKDAGFLTYNSFPVEYLFGSAQVSEWIPDAAERQALGAGARLRVLTLTKTPVPLRIGVATSLREDTITAIDFARFERIARKVVAVEGREWDMLTPFAQTEAIANARKFTQAVFAEFAS